MNLEQLRSLESVVRNKSFSMAAKELYVTQPTISMHIKSLEAELGEQLLVRSTKDIILFYFFLMQFRC
jgi:DNA-binding transcriptional LysR family regulator